MVGSSRAKRRFFIKQRIKLFQRNHWWKVKWNTMVTTELTEQVNPAMKNYITAIICMTLENYSTDQSKQVNPEMEDVAVIQGRSRYT